MNRVLRRMVLVKLGALCSSDSGSRGSERHWLDYCNDLGPTTTQLVPCTMNRALGRMAGAGSSSSEEMKLERQPQSQGNHGPTRIRNTYINWLFLCLSVLFSVCMCVFCVTHFLFICMLFGWVHVLNLHSAVLWYKNDILGHAFKGGQPLHPCPWNFRAYNSEEVNLTENFVKYRMFGP